MAEALALIYAIERDILGLAAPTRQAVRQAQAKPILDAMKPSSRRPPARGSDLARANGHLAIRENEFFGRRLWGLFFASQRDEKGE
jgi:hypothetical protein